MNWWYAKGDQKTGPLDDATFKARIQDGTILPDDLVWNESMSTWSRAKTVPGLFAASVEGGSSLPTGGTGLTHNRDLMALARERLDGKWWLSIAVIVVLGIISQAISAVGQLACAIPVVGLFLLLPYIAVVLVASGVVTWGKFNYFLTMGRGEPADFAQAFTGFSHIWSSIKIVLLVGLFTMLWTFLFIIPGLIKSLSYSMTWYIMNENPGMPVLEAMDRSKAMMDGVKWKLFCLQCRFIGWILLGMLCCFIGVIGVVPYMEAAGAQFYLDVKGRCPIDQPPKPAF